jgi:hypothetical protein
MSQTVPSATLIAAAPDLGKYFATVMADMRAMVAHHFRRHPHLIPIVALFWNRLGRVTRRFERLMALLAAGHLPQPRPQPGRTAPTRPKPPIPTAKGWLVRIMLHDGGACGSRIQHLMSQPGFSELLAICPAVGRVLRPLCHMLGLPNPTPRPRPARKPRHRASNPNRERTASPSDYQPHFRPLPPRLPQARQPAAEPCHLQHRFGWFAEHPLPRLQPPPPTPTDPPPENKPA